MLPDGIHYIVPLRKNSTLIDLRWMRWKGSFLYRGRPIRWGTKETEYGTLFAFEDPLLKGEEEQALLRKVEANKLTMAIIINCIHLSCGQKDFRLNPYRVFGELVFALEFKPQDLILEPSNLLH